MVKWIENNYFNILIIVILLCGFVIRVFLVDKVVVGDLMNYAEWGQKLIQNGPGNYYFSKGWYYSTPVYPPVSIWTFAGAYFLADHRYVLAELHNIVKFPPSFFIVYFYKWGYILLLKLPGILSDLGLALIVYKIVNKLTNNRNKSLASMLFFLFNPISIFISGAWGQTDSVVAILGLSSFLLLLKKKIPLSMVLLFLSLYFKPSWAVLGLFYIFVLYSMKPKLSSFFTGAILVLVLFITTTIPFSHENVFYYGWKLFKERYPLPIGIDGKASISAFNFQTIFFRIDIDYSHEKLLGLTSGFWGLLLFFSTNILAIINFQKQKDKLYGVISGIFIIGFGSFLFMATMLERYFFPAFAPLIILMFTKPKIIFWGIVTNLILAANILYSFYRRGSDEIARPFTNNNFLLIKALSVIQTIGFTLICSNLLKFASGTSKRSTS